jgi:hypothetical protein
MGSPKTATLTLSLMAVRPVAGSFRAVRSSILGSPERVLLLDIERARGGRKSAFRAHLGRTRRAFRSKRSGLFPSVAILIQLHTAVVRCAVRSSLHNQNRQFLRSQSRELRRSPAWAEQSAACTTDRWQNKRPRGAAMGGCGFSDGYRESLHIAPRGHSLQPRPFSCDMNCLARCAAFAQLAAKASSVSVRVHPAIFLAGGRDRSSRRLWPWRKRPAAVFCRKGKVRRACGATAPLLVVLSIGSPDLRISAAGQLMLNSIVSPGR